MTPEQIGNKHVKQVIAFAGAGKLSDDSATPVSLADCNTPRGGLHNIQLCPNRLRSSCSQAKAAP